MDRKTQMDVDYDDELYEEEDYDAPAESDLQYSDEMSRQAVGKLFAGGGKSDNAGGSLVRGYRDGASEKPTRPQVRPVRQAPASLDNSDEAHMERAREIRVVERGRPRRESATTRITQPESQNDVYKSGAREAARAAAANVRNRPVEQPRQNARDASDGVPGRAPNIEEPPRRPPRSTAVGGQQTRPARPQSAQPEEDNLDLDGFRQRYNPGEMISPPRAKNKPVRSPGVPERNVRKERVSISDRDLETINSFRLVIVGSVILVVVLIGFLSFRVAVLANERNEALANVDALQAHAATNITLTEELTTVTSNLATAEHDRDRYRGIIENNRELFARYGIPTGLPDVDPGENGDTQLPGVTPPPQIPMVQLTPRIPEGGYLIHYVQPGEHLASIALIYWPHDVNTDAGRLVRNALVQHLHQTNSQLIRDPGHIEVGWALRIYAHPHVEQRF